MRNETKLVFSSIVIAVLLGFTQVPIAEGAVSWNGFLKQVGFNPPTIYEVSGEGVLLQGELIAADQFELRCREGDILNISPPFSRISTVTPTPPAGTDYRSSGTMFETDDPPEVFGSIPIGFSFRGSIHEISTGDRIPAPSDFQVKGTIVCLSPSSLMSVGGEWQATDTTALIIGYSVLNAYWIAPIGIGIGIAVYLVKRRF